jgi:TPR repeat protein
VEQIGNPKDRKTLLDELISHVAEKDLQKGLELARRYCRKENGNWDIPYQLGSAIFSQDAENMVRTVGEFVSSGDSSSGMGAQLPVAYDFRKALDGLAALNASLKPGEKLAFVPTNLLEEWTRRDPSAAWEWVGEGKVVPFNGREKFLKN